MNIIVNQQSTATRARRSAGFTLIELMVVFALLALIVGLVPIAFNRLHESAQYRDTVRACRN